MSFADNQLYSQTTRGPLPAIQPDMGPGAVVTRTFGSGTDLLPVGMPVCVVPSTGFLDVCDPDEATNAWEKVLYGFVYPAPIQRVSGKEVLGTVMLKGSIPYSVLEAIRGQISGTEQELKDMLRKPAVQAQGIFIDGLTKAGGNAGLAV